ncbi:MAG: hypothetical protein JXA20_13075 [Spirochaetes bacterium]|nr:hypothetical protein [Spirochaetota bacterium]
MSTAVITGIALFLAALLGGRAIAERNLKMLGQEERDRLVDVLTRYRRVHLVPLAIIFVWYLAGSRFIEGSRWAVQYSVYALLCAYIVGVNLFVYRKLRGERLPERYLRGYLVSRLVTFAGLVALVISLILGEGSLAM